MAILENGVGIRAQVVDKCEVEVSHGQHLIWLLHLGVKIRLRQDLEVMASVWPAAWETELPELKKKLEGRKSRRDAVLGGGAQELADRRLRRDDRRVV